MEEKYKYKIGDKVRVKSDLKAYIPYGRVWANNTMLEWKNEILTIEKIKGNKEYIVEENQQLWSEDMFEPVEKNEDISRDLIEGNNFTKATVTLKELQEIKKDNIIPTYYHQGNYDVIEFCNKYEIGFVTGNIIKYIVRYKNKNGIEDLKKAKEYLGRRYIENLIIDSEDKLKFYEENNLNYKQGIILDLVLDNCHKKAEEMLNSLIKYEEKKESDINE